MPSNLAKRDKAVPDIVNWHDDPSGGARGIIAKHVPHPYIIDITKDGRIDVFTLDKRDKPKHVASGRANNVTTAKSKASALAVANIKELKDAVQADIITTSATPVQRREQPAWLVTLKVFIATTLFVFAFLLFARWAVLHRPAWAFRVAGWAAASLFGAWRLIKFVEDLDKRRQNLAKRKLIDAALASKKGKS